MKGCVLQCGRDSVGKKGGLCHRCYARLHFQHQRGIAWILARQQTLEVWQRGLDFLLGKSNVRALHRRKAK